jgi:hypothetical protein
MDKIMEEIDKTKDEAIDKTTEALVKAAHYWKNKDPKKYRQMLNKLKSQRKTPGHKERGYQQVLQAKRRERGGAGTTAGQNGKNGHSSGKMTQNTGTAAKKFASSEKKAGTKLSIDRKDNNKGYASGNTRNVPQKLNVGRHNVDQKKLKNWKSRLKKSNIDNESFITMAMAKALENGDQTLADILAMTNFEQILKALNIKEE